jgi:hypothetical protein
MSHYEVYRAVADTQAALALASTTSPFAIEVRFLGGLTEAQKEAFRAAADRWTRAIVGDLPNVLVDGEVIDDVLILAQGTPIDGPGKILGQAGPTALRPKTADAAAYLPAKGIMSFDTADLQQMEQSGTLHDVIAHEMGHVLGFGTIWTHKKLLKNAGKINPVFTGKQAKKEYATLLGVNRAREVPLENAGGPGTRDSHWRETLFGNELMSGYVGAAGNPLSRLTVASLQDTGYQVDMTAAEPYSLPNLQHLAESGILGARAQALAAEAGLILPNIPIVLPDDSLDV